MKPRSLIVALSVLLALVLTLYWSEHHKPAEKTKASAATAPAILRLDDAAITQVELKPHNADAIVLAKNSAGMWQITQPKPFGADQSAVSGVVSSLASLDSERLVEDKASDLKMFGFDQPALEVKITEKDNKGQQLLIGDNTPTGGAVYAMLAGDPRVFTIAGYSKTRFTKSLNDLRDKRLLTVQPDQVSRVELLESNQEIEFGRSNNKDEWQILKPKPLRADSVQVGELLSKLTGARMDLSASDKDLKDAATAFAQAAPVAIARVTDQSGTQELQVRKSKSKDKDKDKDKDKKDDTYYAKSSVVDGVYKVDSTLGQALDKKLDDFRAKKLFDFGYTNPAKIEMHSGSNAYFLNRGGSDWWSNGKKMDAETVEEFISDLRDLSASKFVDSGFANPVIQLAVTSEDGKRVENVSLAKSGDGFIAKRENDSSLYYLESTPVDALEKAAAALKPAAGSAK